MATVQGFLHRTIRARGPALLTALLLGLVWIGAGRSNPLPPQRNPEADSVAERFSRAASPMMPQTGGSAFASAEPFADGLLPSRRFDFAPRFGKFYNGTPDVSGSDTGTTVPPSTETSVFPDGNLTPIEPPADGTAANAGLIVIRNLPPGSTLSAGTRLSETSWALSPNDARNVVVTLPGPRRLPIKAEIEIFAQAGSSSGAMSVEIREQKVRAAASTRKARICRPAGAKAASAQQNAQSHPAKQQTAAASGTPGLQQLFPQLPFFPGPMNATPPSPGDSVSQQIMINLGAVSSVPEKGQVQKN